MSTSGQSPVRQDRIRAHSKPTKPKMPKFNQKRQRAPRDLFHPIKSCLGLSIGRVYWGIQSPSSGLQTFRSIPPASMAYNKVCCVMQAGHEWTWWVWWQDIHLMDLWYSGISPTWKSLFHRGKSPYKTIISNHFCGKHTVASLDVPLSKHYLQGLIAAEIPPKTMCECNLAQDIKSS